MGIIRERTSSLAKEEVSWRKALAFCDAFISECILLCFMAAFRFKVEYTNR